MGAVLTRLLEVFYTKKLDIVVIGLENRYASMVSGYVSCGSPARLLLREEGASMVRAENFGTVYLRLLHDVVCLDEEVSGWRNHSEAGMESKHGVSECLGSDPFAAMVLRRCPSMPSRRGISKSCCRLNKKILRISLF